MQYKKIIRHGHSLAIVLPIQYCRDLGIKRGDYVAVKCDVPNNIEYYQGEPILILWKKPPKKYH